MKILLVRHGKSMANAAGMIATPDVLLADEGIEQAHQTGQDLKSEHVTAIVSSPFIRAQQTAEVIAGELGIALHDITVIDELHERRMGDLEGKLKQKPSEFFADNNSDHGFETQHQLIARMQVALEKVRLIAKETAGTTVVVGHAVSGLYFLQVAKGHDIFAEFESSVQIRNAEFIEVENI